MFLATGLILIVLFSIIALFAMIFWIWMLIDALKRNDYEGNFDKLIWVLVVIFLHLLGALLYYFLVKMPQNKSKNF